MDNLIKKAIAVIKKADKDSEETKEAIKLLHELIALKKENEELKKQYYTELLGGNNGYNN